MSWLITVTAIYKEEASKVFALGKLREEHDVLMSAGVKTQSGKVGFRATIRIGELYDLERVEKIRVISKDDAVSVRTDIYSLYKTFNDIPGREVDSSLSQDENEKEGVENEN